METSQKTLNDYVDILKRRKWALIIPALTFFLAAAAIALGLPPIYKSTSTILVEEQEIPAEFVTATVTSFAEQRIQTINQRIMSYTRLIGIINRLNLYPDLRDQWTTEEIADFESMSVDVVDRHTGRPTTATIAFTLSYEGKNPDTVQRVTDVLTSLFLQENLEVRERQTKETSMFIEEEMKKVQVNLNELNAEMAEFKAKHVNELPSLLQLNFQSLHTMEGSIARLNERLGALKERKEYLETQLAVISPNLEQEQRSRMEELKLQLAYLKSRFSDEYPDVIKVKAELVEIEKDKSPRNDESELTDNRPDNPAYITLASQLAGIQSDIDSIKRQITEFTQKVSQYRRRIEATPKVEEEYNSLLIKQENTRAKYSDLMRKLMEARVAYGLEKNQKGERFTLIEPARLPKKPHKPNRVVILLIGVVLGIGAGCGAAYLKEIADQTVRDSDTLTLATSFPVLVTIPEITTKRDAIRTRKKRICLMTGLALFIFISLVGFHYLVMDLNIVWASVIGNGRIAL
jgi:polysaccharide chain length determinant protein (PEP-CTERM system associated)